MILRPPLVLVGSVTTWIYQLLFPHHDEKLARRHEEQLAGDIQSFVPFLFNQMRGCIVPNEGIEFPPPFDYAVITVESSGIRFRFTRGRDHFAVQAASPICPDNWYELSTVLSVLELPGVKRGSISTLSQVDSILQLFKQEIADAFSEQGFPNLKAKLCEIYVRDRTVTKQLETEINRKLYG